MWAPTLAIATIVHPHSPGSSMLRCSRSRGRVEEKLPSRMLVKSMLWRKTKAPACEHLELNIVLVHPHSPGSSMLRHSRSWASGGEIIELDVGKKHAACCG